MNPNVKKMLRVVLIALAYVLLGGPAFAKHPKIAPDLEGVDSSSTVDVIIQFAHVPTASHHAMVMSRGGSLKVRLDVVKGAAYRIQRSQLESLAREPEVVYISPDRKIKGMLDLTAAAVNAPTAWNSYGLTGAGIGVAIIDSGLPNHRDLKNGHGSLRIVYQQDFTGAGTLDQYGHGGHVAGIVAGDGVDSTGGQFSRTFEGMAPKANLINLRVLDQNGNSTDSTVISAIGEAITLQTQYNIRVINLSLGRPVYESYLQDPLCQAVEAAWQAGMVVVVAAGNDGRDNSAGTNGYGTIYAPGNDPYVITVGAMKTMGTPQRYDDLIASYSSKGPTMIDHIVKPDIVAPGNMVVSIMSSGASLAQTYPQTLVPLSYYVNGTGSGNSSVYFMLNGTSMAAPVVSGAAALVIQQNPNLTPDQVKARLMMTAYKSFPTSSSVTDPTTGNVYTDYYDVFTVGAGYLDIGAALANTDVAVCSASSSTSAAASVSATAVTSINSAPAAGCALSPTAVFNASTGTAMLVPAPSSIWNTQTLWASQTIWGASQVLDSSGTLWGSQTLWGAQTLWGQQSLWAQTAPSDSTIILVSGE
jgi:serine protease AprX